MSSQKGNIARNRSQKHKNIISFQNDRHDTSHITKKINSLEFYGLCLRCKDIIEWKVKYKKYKPLTVPKKCVKCLEKKVRIAYYIVCEDCCKTHKICSKCSKSSEELEFAESELEKKRNEDLFIQELKQLSERKRRKFLRLLEKGEFTKEDLVGNTEDLKKRFDKESDSEDFDDDDEEIENEEDLNGSMNEENDRDQDDDEDDDLDNDSDDGENVDEDEYDTLDEDDQKEYDNMKQSTNSKKNLKIEQTKKSNLIFNSKNKHV